MTQHARSFKDSNRPDRQQDGNATLYILLVVALFAAVSFILSRQGDSSESSRLERDRAEIIANQVLAYPLQVRQAIDMMLMGGEDVDDLVFALPGEVGYDSPSHAPTREVFHPLGGGLIRATIPDDGLQGGVANPDAGWYLGMFNNIAWTPTTDHDVVLVAWGLAQGLCAAINNKITGSDTIPAVGDSVPNVFIDDSRHGGTNVVELDAALCADCEEKPALCVSNGGNYGFYSLIHAR